jgi:hypothetical protein
MYVYLIGLERQINLIKTIALWEEIKNAKLRMQAENANISKQHNHVRLERHELV